MVGYLLGLVATQVAGFDHGVPGARWVIDPAILGPFFVLGFCPVFILLSRPQR
jgi:hypothetical protein